MEAIKLNLVPSDLTKPICHASQFDDGREIMLLLMDGQKPYILSDEEIELDVKKLDGNIVTTDLEVVSGKNYVIMKTTEQMCAIAGKNNCELKVQKDGNTIYSKNFYLAVEESATAGGVESESEINNLETQIAGLVQEAVENQYDSENVIFDSEPTEGHGTGYTVTSAGIKATIAPINQVIGNSIISNSLDELDLFGNYYINNASELVSSSTWRAYSYRVDDYELLSAALYGSGGSQKAIGFYSGEISDANFISGIRFDAGKVISDNYRSFADIVIPTGAVYALITNRNASGLPTVSGFKKNAVNRLFDDVSVLGNRVANVETEIGNTIEEKLDIDDCYDYASCYFGSDGTKAGNVNYRTFFFDAENIKIINEVKAYTTSSSYSNILFFSDKYPNTSPTTFISRIPCSGNTVNTYRNVAIPEGCKTIAIMNNTSNYATPTAELTRYKYAEGIDKANLAISQIANKITEMGIPHQNIKHIYPNIWCANDFCIVGDEMWCAKPYDNQGEEYTEVRKYKIVDGVVDFSTRVGIFYADFRHWNCVDYCEETDCLIFGNGGNSFDTEGNWFAVVPNPKSLSGTVRLADVGVKYDVDIGYKVQAVWGSSNLGQFNEAIVFSNNATTLKKYILLKDENGNFNGQKVEVDSQTIDTQTGVGGADYWGGKLYIGHSNFDVHEISMSDYQLKKIVNKYYGANGEACTGSMQGIAIDDKYFWTFFNISGAEQPNYLIQYYR